MTTHDILTETQGTAVHIVLNRANKANALTEQMWLDLPEIVAHAQSIPGARVLVLRSATDSVFSAGADVAEYRENAGGVDWGLANHERVTNASNALANCSLATIARIAAMAAISRFGEFWGRGDAALQPPRRIGTR